MSGNTIVRVSQRSGHGTHVLDAQGREHLAPWTRRTLRALLGVLEATAEATRPHLGPLVTCYACGCLCREDENCPGCRAQRLGMTETTPFRRTA